MCNTGTVRISVYLCDVLRKLLIPALFKCKVDIQLYSHLVCACLDLRCVSLCLQIEVQERLPLTNFKGTEVGQLTVEALPCLQDGSLLEDNEVFVEDPTVLIGKPLHFLLNIKDATGLPSRFSKVCMYIYSTIWYKGQC